MFEDPTVVIRTDLGAKLSAAPLHSVAFEIDDADPSGAWGWSVLAQGPAFDITEATDERSEHLRSLPVATWPVGVHDHWLTMRAVRLSGRRFGPIPALDQLAVDSSSTNPSATTSGASLKSGNKVSTTVHCAGATCAGTLELTRTVTTKIEIGHAKTYRTKSTIKDLGETR